jgi:hypothetical protein
MEASAHGGLSRCEESKFDSRIGDAAGVPHAGAEVEGVSSSCRTAITVVVENRFSQYLGIGESTSATTAVAPVLDGQVRTLIMNHLHMVH